MIRNTFVFDEKKYVEKILYRLTLPISDENGGFYTKYIDSLSRTLKPKDIYSNYAGKTLPCDVNFNIKPYDFIFLYIKYLYREKGLRGKRLYDEIDSFLAEHYLSYNKELAYKTIKKYMNAAKKSELLVVNPLGITTSEINHIGELKSDRLEKVAFVLLCCAKYCNSNNPTNNSWTNINDKDLFKHAHLNIKQDDQSMLLYELKEAGYIDFAKKIDNLNIRVKFTSSCDSIDETAMTVTDMRELGYQYLNYKRGGYGVCANCGATFKQNASNTYKYCNVCRSQSPLEKDFTFHKCVDCGEEFEVECKKGRKPIRCFRCQKKHRRECNKKNMEKSRSTIKTTCTTCKPIVYRN